MAPRGRPTRTTRSRPVTATPPPVTTTPPPVADPTTTTSVTSAQLQAMIDEGVNAVLAARAATRNGDDSHTSGTGARKNERMCGVCNLSRLHEMSTRILQGYRRSGQLDKWFERTVTNDVAYAMTWSRLLSDRSSMKKLTKIESCRGMPTQFYSSVVASKPKTMQEAIEMATGLMDRRINTLAENKRKLEDTPRNNQTYQQNKRQNTGRAYAAGNGDRKPKLGHLAKDCRSRPATANNNNRNNNNNNNRNNNNPRAQGANTNAIVCFECGTPALSGATAQWKTRIGIW
ncbi:hypothetical protein Tco_1122829 [Tanacetum coccineum]|uniref:Gag protein n=1 Tax=Tanacetum coccineum TaxID=301880 RepID=A0ABQ5J1M0_9ASTR